MAHGDNGYSTSERWIDCKAMAAFVRAVETSSFSDAGRQISRG
jgi:hypothetical protein